MVDQFQSPLEVARGGIKSPDDKVKSCLGFLIIERGHWRSVIIMLSVSSTGQSPVTSSGDERRSIMSVK